MTLSPLNKVVDGWGAGILLYVGPTKASRGGLRCGIELETPVSYIPHPFSLSAYLFKSLFLVMSFQLHIRLISPRLHPHIVWQP